MFGEDFFLKDERSDLINISIFSVGNDSIKVAQYLLAQ